MLRAGSLLAPQPRVACCRVGTSSSARQLRPLSTMSATELSGESEELFPAIDESSQPTNTRGRIGLTSSNFGSINFLERKNKAQVKRDIALALATPDKPYLARDAIKACGGRWFDTNKAYKSNVLSRFMQTYLTKSQLTPTLGNAMLVSYAENSKDFDSKSLLKSYLDAKIQPNARTYSAIMRMEIARGNYQSAIDVFNFCKEQSLEISDSGLLALISGSVANKNWEILAEAQARLNDTEDTTFLKQLALALGYSKDGDLKGIEDSLLSMSLNDSSALDEKVAMIQACCLVYASLVESNATDAVTSKFLDQFAALRLESIPVYDGNLGLTSAYLYANGFGDASFKLKRAIPENSALPSGVRFSDYNLMGAMVANSKEPADVMIKNVSESNIFEKPIENWLKTDVIYGHKLEDVTGVMKLYLQKPEIGEIRPQFFFPFLVNTSQAKPPEDEMIKGFNVALQNESEEIALHSLEAFHQILITNADLLNLILKNKSCEAFPRSQVAIIRALLHQGRFFEASQLTEGISFDESLSKYLLDKAVPMLMQIDFSSVDLSKVLIKCLKSISNKETCSSYIRKIFNYLTSATATGRNSYQQSVVAKHLAKNDCLFDYIPSDFSMPVITSEQVFAKLINDIFNVMLRPHAMLNPNQFSSNLVQLSSQELEELLAKMDSSECKIELEAEKEAKKMILNATLGRFEEFDALMSKEDEAIRNVFAKYSVVNLMMDTLLRAESFPRAYAMAKKLNYLNVFQVTSNVFQGMKTEDDVELLLSEPLDGYFVDPTSLGLAIGRVREILPPEKMKNALERLLDTKFKYHASAGLMEVYLDDLLQGKMNFEDLKEFYLKASDNGTADNMKIYMVAACLNHPDNESSKAMLKDLLKTDGTTNDAELLAGEILLGYMMIGQQEKALEMSANKAVRFSRASLAKLLRKKDVNVYKSLFGIEGRVIVPESAITKDAKLPSLVGTAMCNLLHRLFSNGSEQERQFVKEVVQKVVADKTRMQGLAFQRLERLARTVGVEVPDDFRNRLLFLSTCTF